MCKMIGRRIHSFILWGSLHNDLSGEEREYSNYLSHSNIILPVNQDLSSSDINKIIDILNA